MDVERPEVEQQDERRLRILIADEKQERLDTIAAVVEALGHEVVGRELDVADVGELTNVRDPQIAFVGLGESGPHALELVSEIVDEAVCPVVVTLDAEDPDFVREAAKRGVFAYVVVERGQEAIEGAIDIALRRYADLHALQAALRRRAVVERAKGILIERHGIGEAEAFELLRRRARSTNRKVVDVADAVLEAQPLLRGRATLRDASDEPV